MKVMRKIIEIDENLCDGCGNCVLSCAEGAIEIIDGKARVVSDKYCDGLGACIGDCPQDALKLIEREAEDFDEEAVKKMLKQKSEKQNTLACGCPSSTVQTFPMADQKSCATANTPKTQACSGASCLGHWPVQIRLVPENAPFLNNSDLVIAADCVPVAYPNFHEDFLKGRSVMIGCPKFDDPEQTVNKLAQTFERSGINSITLVIMEVPCCSALRGIINKALERSGASIPFQEKIVSCKGELISQQFQQVIA